MAVVLKNADTAPLGIEDGGESTDLVSGTLNIFEVDALLALPVKLPTKLVEVSAPVLGLYVNPVSVRGDKLPVAADANKGYLVALVALSAVSVTVAAFPVVL